jgi:periplasmic mercuric ion binding protein
MSKLLAAAAIAISVLASSTALAAEKTITLAVKNMYCADCPFIVRKSLEAVPGVSKAVVSYKDKTAVVTYDDTRADVGIPPHRGVDPAMRDRTLITTGAIGAVLAAICCMTPLLVVVFGAVGLTAWLARADYVLIPALILCLALVAFGLYRRRLHQG